MCVCVCVCVCVRVHFTDMCIQVLSTLILSDMLQLFAEFQLLSGENCTERIRRNWTRCAAVLLNMERERVTSEEEQIKALQLVDKKLRSSGQGATSPAAFGIYQVHACMHTIV